MSAFNTRMNIENIIEAHDLDLHLPEFTEEIMSEREDRGDCKDRTQDGRRTPEACNVNGLDMTAIDNLNGTVSFYLESDGQSFEIVIGTADGYAQIESICEH